MSANLIDNKTLALLEHGTCDSEAMTFTIHEELERKEYQNLDNVLKRLRGKWNKKAKAHIFPFDPTGLIAEVIKSKLMPDKNPTAFFPTPTDAIEVMFQLVDSLPFEYASEERILRVLEPSAGIGGIADYLSSKSDYMHLDLVEILPENQAILRSKGYNPHCMDFMDFPIPENEDDKYDFIFLNPPFSLASDRFAYITHINHALKMLKRSGELVAITPIGWTTNQTKKEEEFRNLVATHGHTVDTLEKGTFSESGTQIETKVISFYSHNWKTLPINGYRTHSEWEFMLYATQEQRHHSAYDALVRNKNAKKEDFEAFALKLISDYAKEDVFVSSDLLPQYVELLQNARREELEEYIYCLQHMFEELCSIEFTPGYAFGGSVYRTKKQLAYKRTLETYFTDKKTFGFTPVFPKGETKDNIDEAISNDLMDRQIQIAQSGGNLLDLMSA